MVIFIWAYGFDSAAPRALEKSKVGEKEKYFIPFNQLYFLKSYIEVTKSPERLSRRVANFSNYAIKWFRFVIDLSKTILFASGRPADNILLLLAHGRV